MFLVDILEVKDGSITTYHPTATAGSFSFPFSSFLFWGQYISVSLKPFEQINK